jgi:hypothetical protein
LAPDLNAPGQRGEEEISPVKARAQKKNGRARGVESGARSRREEHARRGGQVLCCKRVVPRAARAHTRLAPEPGFGACARARADAELQTSLRQADLPEILLRSRRDLQENGFWASLRAWFEGLNFFFPAWTCTFQGVPVGGERYAATAGQLQPALGCTSPPSAAHKVDTCALRVLGSVGGLCMPRPSPAGVQEQLNRKDTVEFAASFSRRVRFSGPFERRI